MRKFPGKERIGTTVHNVSEMFQALDDKVNAQAEFSLYKENGKIRKIDKKSFHLSRIPAYIGVKPETSTVYDKEGLTAILSYYAHNTAPGEKISLKLNNSIDRLLNPEDEKMKKLAFEEAKEYLENLMREIDAKRVRDLRIIDIKTEHPELFEMLGTEGIKGLDLHEDERVIVENGMSSANLARLLCKLYQEDERFRNDILRSKTGDLKKVSGDSDYYTVMELVFRIYDLLNGTHQQAGIGRQNVPDDIMLKLMNPHIKDYQGVEELQRICRKKIHYDPFGSLYILKKPEEVKDFLEKKKGGKRFVKGVQSIMITTAALIVVGFAMYKYGQSSEEIRRREGEKELLAQVLSSNEKGALAQNVTDDIIRKMDTIYGINGFLGQKISDLQLELLRGYIQGMLLEGDDLSKLCDPTKKSASRIAFIHDTIMDSKNLFFIKNSLGLNVTPYENLQDYIDQFTYILSFPGEIELQYCDGVSAESSMIVDTDKTKYQIEYEKFIDDLKSRSYPRPLPEHLFNARMLNMYGKDYMDSKGDHYALLRVRGSDGKEFILAHKKNGPFLATQMNSYTKSEGERVAKDFLEKRASKEGK